MHLELVPIRLGQRAEVRNDILANDLRNSTRDYIWEFSIMLDSSLKFHFERVWDEVDKNSELVHNFLRFSKVSKTIE